MPKLPQVSAKDVVRALEKLGFEVISQKGSHIKMQDKNARAAIVPNHKQIKKGTLKKGLLNPLKITVEEFIKLLKK